VTATIFTGAMVVATVAAGALLTGGGGGGGAATLTTWRPVAQPEIRAPAMHKGAWSKCRPKRFFDARLSPEIPLLFCE